MVMAKLSFTSISLEMMLPLPSETKLPARVSAMPLAIKAGSFEGVGAVQEHQVVRGHGLNGEGVGGGLGGVGDGSGDDAGLRDWPEPWTAANK